MSICSAAAARSASALADRFAATMASRPDSECWYRSAAPTVLCPRRAMFSVRVATWAFFDPANRRKSWADKSPRPTSFAAFLNTFSLNTRSLRWQPPRAGTNSRASGLAETNCARCDLTSARTGSTQWETLSVGARQPTLRSNRLPNSRPAQYSQAAQSWCRSEGQSKGWWRRLRRQNRYGADAPRQWRRRTHDRCHFQRR